MCGIVGYYSTSNYISPEKLLKATKALEHRGPDGQKIWISDNKHVGLGHARLSIIDLTTGDQPLHDVQNKIHLVANGELYDFEKIKENLIQKGHQFKTKSDSEIAINLYKEYGLDFVTHLRGEFAILLWDETNSRFIAIKDRFGIKPLYYTVFKGDTYFASEAKALFQFGIPAKWNTSSLFHSVAIHGNYSNDSLFENIKSLPAGHMMVIDSKGVKITQYWDFDYPLESENNFLRGTPKSEKEYIDEFREIFRESVNLRLRSDVPIATYLSGGLDSSAITGMAQLCSKKPIYAFTLAFNDEDYNEAELAQETCKQFGINHVLVPVSSNDIGKYFESAIWHAETLALNGHVSAKFMLSDVVRKAGFKVVLTGEGSDEVLAGYVHFRQDYLLHKLKNSSQSVVDEEIKKLIENNIASAGVLMSNQRLGESGKKNALGFTPAWFENVLHTKSLAMPFFNSEIREKYQNMDLFSNLLDYFNVNEKLIGRHPVNQSSYLWAKVALQNYILSLLGDRLEMAHSIEGRLPFLDHKLVSFAMKLPVDLKIKDMTEKYILREATKDIITENIYKRNKHPFLAAPAVADSNKDFYNYIQESLRSDNFKDVDVFDHKKIVSFLDDLDSMPIEKKSRYNILLHTLTSVSAINKRLKNSYVPA